MRLAKAGYYDGNPEAVLKAPADMIQSIIEYERFMTDYQDEFVEINRTK